MESPKYIEKVPAAFTENGTMDYGTGWNLLELTVLLLYALCWLFSGERKCSKSQGLFPSIVIHSHEEPRRREELAKEMH
jgi:hypothetical protein